MAVKAGASHTPKVGSRRIAKGARAGKPKSSIKPTAPKTRIPKHRHHIRRGAKSAKTKLPTPRKEAVSTSYLRQKAVRRAWRQEMDLVRRSGKGTRPWTPRQVEQLKKGRQIKGYQGHHIRDVSSHSKRWTGDPRNIRFVTRRQHLREHGGGFRNATTGKLIDRQNLSRQTVKRRTPSQG